MLPIPAHPLPSLYTLVVCNRIYTKLSRKPSTPRCPSLSLSSISPPCYRVYISAHLSRFPMIFLQNPLRRLFRPRATPPRLVLLTVSFIRGEWVLLTALKRSSHRMNHPGQEIKKRRMTSSDNTEIQESSRQKITLRRQCIVRLFSTIILHSRGS